MPRRTDPAQIARRRHAIVTAAAQLFGRYGYDQTSVAAIARAAGLSSASVFYYYENKASVFRAIFEQELPAAENLVTRHRDAADPVAAILDILSHLARDAAAPEASGLLVALLRRVEYDPELLHVVERSNETIRRAIAALIRRGIDDGSIDPDLDPEQTAAWLQTVVDACYLNARPGFDPDPLLRRTAQRCLAPSPAVPASPPRSDDTEGRP